MIKKILAMAIASIAIYSHAESLSVASQPIAALQTTYDSRIVDANTQQLLDLSSLARQLKDADVIFMGEYHGNNAAHLLQAKLQYALYQQRPQQVLSMEQFTRAHQDKVNQYLAGKIGEQSLIDEAEGWANYKASYRPLVEFAKLHQLPVVAANAPSDIVRCVGRKGTAYIQLLDAVQKQQIAQQPFYYTEEYLKKFSKVMHFGREPASQAEKKLTPTNGFYAQILRDNSMAEVIAKAHQSYPDHQIIHLNGTFHSERFLGTVDSLKHLHPELKIAVISPVQMPLLQSIALKDQDLTLGNYIYYIPEMPVDYIQDEKRIEAMQKMMDAAKDKAQSCLDIPLSPPSNS